MKSGLTWPKTINSPPLYCYFLLRTVLGFSWLFIINFALFLTLWCFQFHIDFFTDYDLVIDINKLLYFLPKPSIFIIYYNIFCSIIDILFFDCSWVVFPFKQLRAFYTDYYFKQNLLLLSVLDFFTMVGKIYNLD